MSYTYQQKSELALKIAKLAEHYGLTLTPSRMETYNTIIGKNVPFSRLAKVFERAAETLDKFPSTAQLLSISREMSQLEIIERPLSDGVKLLGLDENMNQKILDENKKRARELINKLLQKPTAMV